jgi:hypothetical protein
LTDAVAVSDHAFCVTYYRCVGYLVVIGEASDPTDVEKASLTVSDTVRPAGGNVTIDNGYVADIVARLGFKGFE